ncbi:protein-L-isoaspartate(D-aspartate) O-methyltransferase [Limnohabitans sp.]|uniref:protein-L-isoaspartate(D-aspartate) O-methyltransferase n=1 Tax=Limnohabitans sp. TaxID=1907725 RepID=UPI00286EEE5F|nr:protein-L-isoaspartate(D-aspartate) O-methyltransferase [Limnohabitans sp.]
MKQRPSFPARLDSGKPQATPKTLLGATRVVTPQSMARSKAAGMVSPTGVGLDSSTIRARMVQKLAEQGIADAGVLEAMGRVERHRFVDSALVNQSYEDTSLPIGLGQTISKPSVVARMIALLREAPGLQGEPWMGRVLEIGTGCGYQAAVLACVAREVYSIERLRGLHDKARENLRPLRLPNVHMIFGDGMLGYAQGAPYSAIISAAGGDAVPQAWIEQLAMGGRLVAPTQTSSGQQALVVIDKTPQGLQQALLEAVNFVPLKSGIA